MKGNSYLVTSYISQSLIASPPPRHLETAFIIQSLTTVSYISSGAGEQIISQYNSLSFHLIAITMQYYPLGDTYM